MSTHRTTSAQTRALTPPQPSDMLTIPATAALLGVSKSAMSNLMSAKIITPAGRGGPSGRAWLFRRGDLDAYLDMLRQRMTMDEVRRALGFRSARAVKDLMANGHLHAFVPPGTRKNTLTFDRAEVEVVAANLARRLNGREALLRAGMTDLGVLQHWLLLSGGTIHWHGAVAAYEPDDVDRARQAYRPDGGIDVNEVAAILGETVTQVRQHVASGKLTPLSQCDERGWRFDRPVVDAYKCERERQALRALIARWPRQSDDESDGSQRSSAGGRIYTAKLRTSQSSPPVTVPETWNEW